LRHTVYTVSEHLPALSRTGGQRHWQVPS